MSEPGRTCPLRYRYGPAAIAAAETRPADTLYVVGGLYGNFLALEAIEQLARSELHASTLCFNGDFNWFNVDDSAFSEINRRVLVHDATLGNVEAELDSPLDAAFAVAEVDLFASTHTCLPALRRVALKAGGEACVVNNGAAGMPNFAGDLSGLCTRIGTRPSPHPALAEVRIAGAWVALLPVRFDAERWQREFLAQWPPGSAAWESYFHRITRGPAFTSDRALGLASAL